MKKIIFQAIIALVIFGCETEEINETSEIITGELVLDTSTTKKSTRSMSMNEHKSILARNSFVIGELMRLSSSDKAYILENLDPIKKTVSMGVLLDPNLNSIFYDHYVYVAMHAQSNYSICTPPDPQNLWPPVDPDEPFRKSVTKNHSSLNEVEEMINDLIINNSELYIPNPVNSGNIYAVGHPLNNVISNQGIRIYSPPIFRFTCYTYSTNAWIGTTNVTNNDAIILSRPNLSNGNPFPYIDFNIRLYIEAFVDPGTDDPYIGGPGF